MPFPIVLAFAACCGAPIAVAGLALIARRLSREEAGLETRQKKGERRKAASRSDSDIRTIGGTDIERR